MSEQDGQTGGFEVLEPANLVVLGDKKGQSKAFGGLLVDIIADDKYPDKKRYVCVGVDGNEYEITGNAALTRRVKREHIGCLVKFIYKGMARGSGNEYKEIEVLAQPRNRTTDEQKKKFPRWAEFGKPEEAAPEAAAASVEDVNSI